MSLFSAQKGLDLHTGMGRCDTEAVRIRRRGAGFGAAGAKGPAAARTGGGVPPPSAPPHRFLVKTGASGSGNLRKSSRGQRKQESVRILCLSFLQQPALPWQQK